MVEQTAIMTPEQKDKFVAELISYGTDFVAPVYAIIDEIEKTVLQSDSHKAMQRDAKRYRALRSPTPNYHKDNIAVCDLSFKAYFLDDLDNATDALVERFHAAMKDQP